MIYRPSTDDFKEIYTDIYTYIYKFTHIYFFECVYIYIYTYMQVFTQAFCHGLDSTHVEILDGILPDLVHRFPSFSLVTMAKVTIMEVDIIK